MTSSKSYPWKNGYWYSDEQANFIVIVENDKVTWKKFREYVEKTAKT